MTEERKKRNINYGIVKFKITTTYPKKPTTTAFKKIEWLYVGDTVAEVNSLPTANNLRSRIGSRFNLKPNQSVSITGIKTIKNLSKTTYEV